MKYGPVDVVVLALGEPKFDGTILEQLIRLVDSGTIRLLDAMVLIKDADGAVYGVDIEDLPAEVTSALGLIESDGRGMFDAEDSATLAEGLVPGSTVVALAIENTWAVPLINSFVEAGAEIALTSRIPAPIVEDALAAASNR